MFSRKERAVSLKNVPFGDGEGRCAGLVHHEKVGIYARNREKGVKQMKNNRGEI